MSIKHPAAVTQFRYFPLVMSYINQSSNLISFAEIQQNLIRKNYELQAENYDSPFEDSENPQPPSRSGPGRLTDMYNQLSQILNELVFFKLVEVEDRRNHVLLEMIPYQKPGGDTVEDWICRLTPQGEDLWQLAATREKSLEFKARYFNLMYHKFNIVRELIRAVHNDGEDYVILPHVTAQQLGLEDLDLEDPKDLAFYLDKVTESVLDTYYKVVKNPKGWVREDFWLLRPKLEKKIQESIQRNHQKGKKYARFLIIARIRDYCVSRFAYYLTGDNTISGRSLEALSSRLSKMEIMGYSDYTQRKGRLLFLCSWVVPPLNAPLDNSSNYKKFYLELMTSKPHSPNFQQYLIFHQPKYYLIKDKFEASLEGIFNKLYFAQHKQFVSIPDVRENVCLELKISAKTFDRLMVAAYKDSFNSISNLEITLSSDPGYVEYGLERWHRAPLDLEGRPMTVVRIKRREYDNIRQRSR